MRNDRHFEIAMTQTCAPKHEAERLATMIADLYRTVRNLELSIEAEEDRARNHD